MEKTQKKPSGLKKLMFRWKLLVNITFVLILAYSFVMTICKYTLDTDDILKLVMIPLSFVGFVCAIAITVIDCKTDLPKAEAKEYKKKIKLIKKIMKLFVCALTIFIAVSALMGDPGLIEKIVSIYNIVNNAFSIFIAVTLYILGSATRAVSGAVKADATKTKNDIKNSVSNTKKNLEASLTNTKENIKTATQKTKDRINASLATAKNKLARNKKTTQIEDGTANNTNEDTEIKENEKE